MLKIGISEKVATETTEANYKSEVSSRRFSVASCFSLQSPVGLLANSLVCVWLSVPMRASATIADLPDLPDAHRRI